MTTFDFYKKFDTDKKCADFLESKATKKELLYFGGRDNHDVKEPIPETFDYIKLVVDSYQRFADHFDKVEMIEKLEPLDETSIAQVHSQIITALNTPK
jgi:hypothetical protein